MAFQKRTQMIKLYSIVYEEIKILITTLMCFIGFAVWIEFSSRKFKVNDGKFHFDEY